MTHGPLYLTVECILCKTNNLTGVKWLIWSTLDRNDSYNNNYPNSSGGKHLLVRTWPDRPLTTASVTCLQYKSKHGPTTVEIGYF